MITAMNKYSKLSYQTPVWNTQSSNQQQQINTKPKQIKRNSQMSILNKIRASKNIDLENIDISHKITKTSSSFNGYENYVQINADKNSKYEEMKNISNQTKPNIGSISPINISKINHHHKSKTVLKVQKQKQNVIYTPARSKISIPTQSYTENVTTQKSTRKIPNQSSRITRPALVQLSVHQQLYLDSRKKQIKKSTQLMIQNQYFKKKHPFKPQIGQVSEFLAEERFEKIKERQQFQKQFQQFDDWKQDRKLNLSATKSSKKIDKNINDLRNQKQSQQKQAQLKNYTMLRQFFFYLTDSQDKLNFPHLSSKKLCELPSPIIKFLQPIIEAFYKNKNKYTLTWLQFLSEFNLKVNKRKAFYSLLEKWFFVKFGVTFQGATMQQKFEQKQSKLFTKDEDSTTYVGNSVYCDKNLKLQESGKRR